MTAYKRYLINWVGGKRQLRKIIESLVPKDIQTYIEPFGGGAWVLFYKDKWAELEVYNDLDGSLVNLFRIVKYHPKALKEEIGYLLGSREMFFQFLNGSFVTDIQRAAQFFFIVTRSFAGNRKTFGSSKKPVSVACKSQKNVLSKIDEIHSRLDQVLIENRDFETIIKQYDHENAFFYCDPPYTSGVGYDVVSTKEFEHERLRDSLKKIKGRFLLSYDDSPKIKELYKDFEIVEIERLCALKNKMKDQSKKVYKELLIANYPIKELYNNVK